ncbi:UbiX family flavin prenyltransferase [bacterium CPR1]|nr:UbiX family flavin prenyltransferase [bacterium CPR1]
MQRIVVGISGSSAPIYGVRLLQVLREQPEIEAHLVLSSSVGLTLQHEAPDWPLEKVRALADVVYDDRDLAAPIASGSFLTKAMVVAPCSMKTLAAVAHSLGESLLLRAADVHLKERRPLVLVPRETPLHLGHLRNMVAATEMGATILPPMVAFYHHPETVLDIVDHTVGKVLDQLGLEHRLFRRWGTAAD